MLVHDSVDQLLSHEVGLDLALNEYISLSGVGDHGLGDRYLGLGLQLQSSDHFSALADYEPDALIGHSQAVGVGVGRPVRSHQVVLQ